MARQSRLVLPGLAHLVVLRALTGVHPCPTWDDRQRFLEILHDASAGSTVQWHAYATLPGEVRLLATPAAAQALSHWVQTTGRRYVGAFNRRHGRVGTLWAGRFRCAPLQPGAWTLRALRYVDGAAPGDPSATSGRQRCGGSRDWPLVDPPEYWSLGNTPFERERAYALQLAEPLPAAAVQRLERCVDGGWVCGEAAFIKGLTLPGRRLPTPRPRGRPRRAA
ncbi:MAG: transposase [Rubrivivax sp.]|nr:transposase [Rubrivivax sp.]